MGNQQTAQHKSIPMLNEQRVPSFLLDALKQNKLPGITESNLPTIYANQKALVEGRYHSRLSPIKSGGQGTVYKVKTKQNKLIALKISKARTIDEATVFIKEYLKMKQLSHNNIIKTIDWFLIEKDPNELLADYEVLVGIEMELMLNSLDYLINDPSQQPLSATVIQKILFQMCEALKTLKDAQIIHRDIKPQNILIRELDLQKEHIQVVLADFGLARNLDTFSSSSYHGTTNFIAPELLQKNRNLNSYQVDIFSLGVTMYQLMTFDTTYIANLDFEQVEKKIAKKNLYSNKLIEIVSNMCIHDPYLRVSVEQISKYISHRYILARLQDKTYYFGLDQDWIRDKQNGIAIRRIRTDVPNLSRVAEMYSRIQFYSLKNFINIHNVLKLDMDLFVSMEIFDLAFKFLTCKTEIIKAIQSMHASLSTLHDKGFVHGDICLENFGINSDGDYVLIDFDLCKKQTDDYSYIELDYYCLKCTCKELLENSYLEKFSLHFEFLKEHLNIHIYEKDEKEVCITLNLPYLESIKYESFDFDSIYLRIKDRNGSPESGEEEF